MISSHLVAGSYLDIERHSPIARQEIDEFRNMHKNGVDEF